MKTSIKTILIGFLVLMTFLIASGLLVVYILSTNRENTGSAVTNFASCVESGGIVREINPRECLSHEGDIFVEEKSGEDGKLTEEINSFEECAQAGNPVLESFPERCITEDGRSFTRSLTDDEQRLLQH